MHITARLRRVTQWPFRGAGRPAAFIVTGVLIQLAVPVVMALPWISFVPETLAATLLAVLVPLAAVMLAGPLPTEAQHARFRTRLGVDIPSPYGTASPAARVAAFAGGPTAARSPTAVRAAPGPRSGLRPSEVGHVRRGRLHQWLVSRRR
ncbi:hypothetical protein [Streptomyces graminilatus]|uniref:hypothetical protein n=1 Tax=Streptomyces graminilatus TaxID=1464070 RepID=UPI0012FEBC5F|nr:hypothetical protein [Streptomyces graminilatus]